MPRTLPARDIRDRHDGVRGQAFRYRSAERVSTSGSALVIHPEGLHDGHAREATGFAYRMLYIVPMLVRIALGVCAITRFVAEAVAEDPALAAVLAEAFETFPGALDPLALPAVIAGLSDALWRPLRSQDRPAASPRRQHCSKPCACLSRHCDREFGDRTVERLDEGRKTNRRTAPPMPALTTWRGR